MLRTIVLITAAALLLGLGIIGTTQPASCNACIPIFCGPGSCPTGCWCAVPMGKATGTCMGGG
jgi:hypothetical protein